MSAGWTTRLGPWPTRLGQAGVLLGLSSLLGLAFNASNPLGVRWADRPPGRSNEVGLQRSSNPPAASAASAAPEPALTATVPPATSHVASAFSPPPPPPLPPPRTATASAPALVPSAPAARQVTSPPGTSSAPSPAFRAPVSVHWNEVKPLVEAGTALLVDVRIKPAYDAGHIPGAVHLAENSTPGQIEAFRAQHGTNQYVVAYCSSTSCSLSYRLAQKLARDYGFAKVDYMTGGYVEYQRETALAAGGSATASNSPPALTSGTAERTPLPISWTKAADWLKQGQAVLVDARPAADYAAGHLAGALSLPRHASAQELAAFGQRVGTNQIIVVYGERAGSLTALDLASRLTQELGVPAVRFLPQGYQELAPLPASTAGKPSP